MAELILVRHGQASFGADDYDKLSELGHRQSRWLGEHFAERGITFDHVVRGTLRRHAETHAAICEGMGAHGMCAEDAGFNEYDSHSLLSAHGGKPDGDDRRAHFRLLREVLYAWTDGTLAGDAHEKFAAFHARVNAALAALHASKAKRILVVTSGGPISTIVAGVLKAPPSMVVDLNLQTRNAGYSELRSSAKGWSLVSFNNIPHLDRPDRLDAVTYS